jgi:hypothetical protein
VAVEKPKDFYGRKDTFVSPESAAEQRKLMADCDKDMQRIIAES